MLNPSFNPTLSNIRTLLDDTEVILLSRQEAQILDGSKKNLYPLEGREDMNGLGRKSSGTKKERLDELSEAIGTIIK